MIGLSDGRSNAMAAWLQREGQHGAGKQQKVEVA